MKRFLIEHTESDISNLFTLENINDDVFVSVAKHLVWGESASAHKIFFLSQYIVLYPPNDLFLHSLRMVSKSLHRMVHRNAISLLEYGYQPIESYGYQPYPVKNFEEGASESRTERRRAAFQDRLPYSYQRHINSMCYGYRGRLWHFVRALDAVRFGFCELFSWIMDMKIDVSLFERSTPENVSPFFVSLGTLIFSNRTICGMDKSWIREMEHYREWIYYFVMSVGCVTMAEVLEKMDGNDDGTRRSRIGDHMRNCINYGIGTVEIFEFYKQKMGKEIIFPWNYEHHTLWPLNVFIGSQQKKCLAEPYRFDVALWLEKTYDVPLIPHGVPYAGHKEPRVNVWIESRNMGYILGAITYDWLMRVERTADRALDHWPKEISEEASVANPDHLWSYYKMASEYVVIVRMMFFLFVLEKEEESGIDSEQENDEIHHDKERQSIWDDVSSWEFGWYWDSMVSDPVCFREISKRVKSRLTDHRYFSYGGMEKWDAGNLFVNLLNHVEECIPRDYKTRNK